MLYARFIILVLLFRGQAAYIHDFMAYEQFWEQDGSGMDGSGMDGSGLNIKEWPPFDDRSQTCDGTRNEIINITFTDTTGCYQFQTPGFNDGGYPNSTRKLYSRYFCEYVLMFGDNNVTGTVTTFKEGFEFPTDGYSGDHLEDYLEDYVGDYFGMVRVDSISDPEDVSEIPGIVVFRGTLSSDKERTFNSQSIRLGLIADRTISGNGAQVLLCFD